MVESTIAPSSPVRTLQSAITEAISKAGTDVVARAQSAFVDAEIKRRADLIVAGVNLVRQADLEIRKIKPDQTGYDSTGKVIREEFSKAKFEETKKLRDSAKRIEDAVNNALTENSPDAYNKLDEVIKKGLKAGKDSQAESGDA